MDHFTSFGLRFGCLFFIMSGCQGKPNDSSVEATEALPSSPSQREGDPSAGLDYSLYGDYLGSGIPTEISGRYFGADNQNLLNREGDSATIPSAFSPVSTPPLGLKVLQERTSQWFRLLTHPCVNKVEYLAGVGNALLRLLPR